MYTDIYLYDVDSDLTNCEKIGSHLYKYEIKGTSKEEVDEYGEVLLYSDVDGGRTTGNMELSSDKNYLIIGDGITNYSIYSPWYSYAWSEYDSKE